MPADRSSPTSTPEPTLGSLLRGARPSTAAPCPATASTCSTSYDFVDLARKVVGVGSVGTRCWVALFVGPRQGRPAVPPDQGGRAAVGEPFLGPSEYANHGQRVVEGQRLMQGASDIFLGWDSFRRRSTASPATSTSASCGTGSCRPTSRPWTPRRWGSTPQMCGWALARAHARSGDAIAIGSYLGAGDRFDQADGRVFAAAYADQNERDFDALTARHRRRSRSTPSPASDTDPVCDASP